MLPNPLQRQEPWVQPSNMGNKKEELVLHAQSESYDVRNHRNVVGILTTGRTQWMVTSSFRKIGREDEGMELKFM